jgi:uncharacterized membrane protein YeiH
MPVYDFHVPVALDYLATFSWAVSGAAVAIHKRFDLMGVTLVAVLASTGGGLLRDGIFLNRTPAMLTDRYYLLLILAAVVVTVLFRSRILGESVIDTPVSIMDAVGTPTFAIVGMQYSLLAGIPLPGVVLIGLLNGFGGGILRDMVVNEVPSVLRPGQWAATLALAACVFFLVLVLWFRTTAAVAAWITVACYFAARMLAIRFDLRSRPLLPKGGEGKP